MLYTYDFLSCASNAMKFVPLRCQRGKKSHVYSGETKYMTSAKCLTKRDAKMLYLDAVYDHTNYPRWGTIYLSEMKGLEISQPAVHREFIDGNFVVIET